MKNTRMRRLAAGGFATVALSTGMLVGAAGTAGAAPIANACGGVTAPGETTTVHSTYTVQKGDTLYRIVRDIHASRAVGPQPIVEVARKARELRNLNATVVRRRGNLIFPGQVLRLPESLHYCTKG